MARRRTSKTCVPTQERGDEKTECGNAIDIEKPGLSKKDRAQFVMSQFVLSQCGELFLVLEEELL